MAEPKLRNRETSAEWAATVPDPVTAEKAKERLEYVYDYSTDAINAVLSTLGGTVPPAQSMMPELYEARKNVEAAISTIGALAERSPQAHVAPNYRDLGVKLGARLIDESNAAMEKAKTGDSIPEVAKEITKAAGNVARKAAGTFITLGGKVLTPMEVGFGLLLADHFLNKGKWRKRLLKGL